MSLDIYLIALRPTEVYSGNITHNLGRMANEAGVYDALWHPEKLGITTAVQLIEPLRAGLRLLLEQPDKFKEFNPSNGWGDYKGLLELVSEYLRACENNPDAEVSISR